MTMTEENAMYKRPQQYNLSGLKVAFEYHTPRLLADRLIATADKVSEHVISWREGCDKIREDLDCSHAAASSFLAAYTGSGREPNFDVLERAVGAFVDGSLDRASLIHVVECEYAFHSEIAAAWADCLVAWEKSSRNERKGKK